MYLLRTAVIELAQLRYPSAKIPLVELPAAEPNLAGVLAEPTPQAVDTQVE